MPPNDLPIISLANGPLCTAPPRFYPMLDCSNVMSQRDSLNRSSTRRASLGSTTASEQSRLGGAEFFLETQSPKVLAALEMIDRAASCDAPVVLQGEAGVGKQVFARVLHARHRRHAKPFVVIACHGSQKSRWPANCLARGKPFSTFGQTGCIETAAGGTLFSTMSATCPRVFKRSFYGCCVSNGSFGSGSRMCDEPMCELWPRRGVVFRPMWPKADSTRSLFPSERHRNSHTAATRTARRHSPAGWALLEFLCRRTRTFGTVPFRQCRGGATRVRLAG